MRCSRYLCCGRFSYYFLHLEQYLRAGSIHNTRKYGNLYFLNILFKLSLLNHWTVAGLDSSALYTLELYPRSLQTLKFIEEINVSTMSDFTPKCEISKPEELDRKSECISQSMMIPGELSH